MDRLIRRAQANFEGLLDAAATESALIIFAQARIRELQRKAGERFTPEVIVKHPVLKFKEVKALVRHDFELFVIDLLKKKRARSRVEHMDPPSYLEQIEAMGGKVAVKVKRSDQREPAEKRCSTLSFVSNSWYLGMFIVLVFIFVITVTFAKSFGKSAGEQAVLAIRNSSDATAGSRIAQSAQNDAIEQALRTAKEIATQRNETLIRLDAANGGLSNRDIESDLTIKVQRYNDVILRGKHVNPIATVGVVNVVSLLKLLSSKGPMERLLSGVMAAVVVGGTGEFALGNVLEKSFVHLKELRASDAKTALDIAKEARNRLMNIVDSVLLQIDLWPSNLPIIDLKNLEKPGVVTRSINKLADFLAPNSEADRDFGDMFKNEVNLVFSVLNDIMEIRRDCYVFNKIKGKNEIRISKDFIQKWSSDAFQERAKNAIALLSNMASSGRIKQYMTMEVQHWTNAAMKAAASARMMENGEVVLLETDANRICLILDEGRGCDPTEFLTGKLVQPFLIDFQKKYRETQAESGGAYTIDVLVPETPY